LPTIILTVTNDLTYDQRMQRICTSLSQAGYTVVLVGRQLKTSKPLQQRPYQQKRLACYFNKGFAFYGEYNLRLFCWLLFKKADIVCAIDLDTILPVLFTTQVRGQKRVYDAHELFTEQVEIITRPFIHKIWLGIEKFAVPKFPNGYTVNQFIADEFKRRYAVSYAVIRNLPIFTENGKINQKSQYPQPATNNLQPETKTAKFIIYQGAVNKGRCFEQLVPAMQQVNATLVICGEGNFFNQVKQLIKDYGVEDKVVLKGYVMPEDLKNLTPMAHAAVTLFENTGLNQYHSLGNRFFDYIMAGVPQVCVDYPEYRVINDTHRVALLIKDTNAGTIAAALNKLLDDNVLQSYLAANCITARTQLQWQHEAASLIEWYKKLL